MSIDRYVAIEAALFIPVLVTLELVSPVFRHLGLFSAGLAWAMWILVGTMIYDRMRGEPALPDFTYRDDVKLL